MIAHLAFAEGSPCPTLVLDGTALPGDEASLAPLLLAARSHLVDIGAGQVLKIALITPSPHPLFDLSYRFVQVIPGRPDRLDFTGSCGHSILGSITAAAQLGWLSRLGPGDRVRVELSGGQEHVVAEVDQAWREAAVFTAHFLRDRPTKLADLLLDDGPTTLLDTTHGPATVSLVSSGNPYVWADAQALGAATRGELFADDRTLYDRLAAIKAAASAKLGWDPASAFPKVACVGAYEPGRVAVRALSVPSWHPTLALTGATCLGAAAAIPGTVPHAVAARAGIAAGAELAIDTPGGSTAVEAATVLAGDDARIGWISVRGKRVRLLGAVSIDPLRHYPKEGDTWLPLSA